MRIAAFLAAYLLSALFSGACAARYEATAARACPAFNNLKHSKNTGNVHLKRGYNYRIIEQRSGDYLVKVPNGFPLNRWVEKSCFTQKRRVFVSRKRDIGRNGRVEYLDRDGGYEKSGENLLVLNWHNSFCETHSHRKECRNIYSYASNHLVLHGLWPRSSAQIYCGVSGINTQRDRLGKWHSLPRLRYSADTRSRLLKYMPGSISALDRHEWIKHGSCYSRNPELYFSHALALTEQVDSSAVGKFFRANTGKRVTLLQIRRVFDAAFGKGAGKRVAMVCRNGLLQEIRINLRGKGYDLKRLIMAAGTLRSRCYEAIVDAPGRYRR